MGETFGRSAFEKVMLKPGEFEKLCEDENIKIALDNLIGVINVKKSKKHRDFFMFYSILSLMDIYCKFVKDVPQNDILNSIFIQYKKKCWEGVEKARLSE